jgi:error-prone DNA polymerase
MTLGEHVTEDYVATGLSLKQHPVAFFRDRLTKMGAVTNAQLRDESLKQDQYVTVAGLVLIRQMPGTAKGVVFMTIEDETGAANIIVWPAMLQKFRRIVMTSRFVAVRGRLQRAGLVIHVVSENFRDLSNELHRLSDGLPFADDPGAHVHPGGDRDVRLVKSRDFH